MVNHSKFFVGIASLSILTGSQLCAYYNYENDYDYDEKAQFQESQWNSPNYHQTAPQVPTKVEKKPRVSVFNRSRHYQNPQSLPIDESAYYSSYNRSYDNSNNNSYNNTTYDQNSQQGYSAEQEYSTPYEAQFYSRFRHQTQNE